MARPQQQDVARSGHNALDPAAPTDRTPPGTTGRDPGPVPVDNQPGHHPEHEQDRPDLDDMAARLGIDEPAQPPARSRLRTAALVGAGVAVAVGLAVTAAGLLRRRGSRAVELAEHLADEVAARTPFVDGPSRGLAGRAGDLVDAVAERTPIGG